MYCSVPCGIVFVTGDRKEYNANALHIQKGISFEVPLLFDDKNDTLLFISSEQINSLPKILHRCKPAIRDSKHPSDC